MAHIFEVLRRKGFEVEQIRDLTESQCDNYGVILKTIEAIQAQISSFKHWFKLEEKTQRDLGAARALAGMAGSSGVDSEVRLPRQQGQEEANEVDLEHPTSQLGGYIAGQEEFDDLFKQGKVLLTSQSCILM